MRIILAMVLVLALLLPGSASALTVQEVVALSQAGVSDEVLLTLIDRDKTIFAIGPDQLVALKRDNVSEKLVLAMLRSGRPDPPPAPAAEATRLPPVEPIEIIVGHGPDRPHTYHEFDRTFGSTVIYTVPYIAYAIPSIAVLPTRGGSCEGGRRTTSGPRTDRTIGLADASQKFVNDTLLPVLAAAESGATDCHQTPPDRRGWRPRR
jgi:hypothetical protein